MIFRVLALLVLLCAPGLAHAANLAFVINSNDASLSLLDIDTHQELRRIPMLREPHHMALTPDKRSLVVGDTAGNSLFFLDPRTGAMQRRVTVSDPYQLVYSPDGRYLTVAGLARAQIDIYDAKTLSLLHRIPARSLPSHLNYAPDSSVVFVSLQGTDRLIAIETASGRVKWGHPGGPHAGGGVVGPRAAAGRHHGRGAFRRGGPGGRSRGAGGADRARRAHDVPDA